MFIPAAAPASNNNDSKRRDSTVSQATRQSSQKRNSFIAAANNSTPSGGRHSILNRPAGITSPIFVFEPPPLYPYFHLIQHIEADASDQLETSLIYKLFKVCPNLRSLVIKSLFSFSDDVFLKHIVPFMPRLESLSLHCTGLSEKSIDSLLKYCHKIHSIAIYAPMPASFYRKWLVCNTTSVLRLITSIYFTQSSFETGEQADQIAKLFADAGNLKHIGFSGGESCVKYATVFATAFKKAYNENQNAEVKATPSAAFSKNQPLRGKLQVTGIKTPVQRLIQQSVAVGGGSLGNLRSSHSNLTSGIPFSYSFSSMHSAIDWSSLAEFIEIIPQQAVKRLFLDCQIIMKHPESISPSMFPLFLESLELSAVCLPLFQNHSPNDIENNNNDISSNTPPHTNNLDSQIFKTLINLKRLKLHFNNHDLPFLDTDLAVVLSAVPCTLSQLEIIQNCKNPLGDECNTALLRFNRLSLIRIVGTEGLRVSTIYSLVQRNRTTLKRVHFFLIGNDVLGDELLRTCAIKTRNRRMSGGGAAVLDESAETATRMEMTLNEWGVRKLLRKISSNK